MAGDGCANCQIIGIQFLVAGVMAGDGCADSKQFSLVGVMAGDGCADCQIIGKQFSLAGIEMYRYKGSA